jgi:hypothetical protein
MKKLTVVLLLLAGLAFVGAKPASAQSFLSLNFGTITDSSFSFDPFFWTAGATLDIYLGPHLSLSPEATMVVHNFKFGSFILAPAVLLNVEFASLFFGGGISKWFLLGSDIPGSPSADFSLKLNAGFKGDNLRLAAYMFTPFDNLFNSMAVGVSLGFYF